MTLYLILSFFRTPLLLQLKMLTLRSVFPNFVSHNTVFMLQNARFSSMYFCVPRRLCPYSVFFPQLARYLNRTYWEKKQEEVRKSPTPSAPAPVPLAEPMPVSQPVESHAPVQPINIVEVRRVLSMRSVQNAKTVLFYYCFIIIFITEP